ncbi:MAG: helix-turn-helix domain-containing protein, partial [Gemmatimonadota bacterium]
LKNLVESMVVLVPGRVIGPQDIPPEIRKLQPSSGRLLPVPIARADEAGPAPELEFIFRTLIQMRIDVDDLRRQFENYRITHAELPAPPVYASVPLVAAGRALDVITAGEPDAEDEDEEAVVVFKPGVTIQEMEKDAIIAALKSVAGNRRKAAEMLGLGERTLYRKIKEYGIPL